MKYHLLLVAFTLLGISANAHGQKPLNLKLQPLVFDFTNPALKNYVADRCAFVPRAGSTQTFAYCVMYQANASAKDTYCLEFAKDWESNDTCVLGGLWVGLLSQNGLGFAKEWFIDPANLEKIEIENLLSSDAQGNLWAVQTGWLPEERKKLLVASTKNKDLFFQTVHTEMNGIDDMLFFPQGSFLVRDSSVYKKFTSLHQSVWQLKFTSLMVDKLKIGVEFVSSLVRTANDSMVWAGQGRIITERLFFIVCISPDGQATGSDVLNKNTPYEGAANLQLINLGNDATKLVRGLDERGNGTLSIYPVTPACKLGPPDHLSLPGAATIVRKDFHLYSLGSQGDMLVSYAEYHGGDDHESRVWHVAKISADNQLVWDHIIDVPENKIGNDYAYFDLIVDMSGENALLLFSKSLQRVAGDARTFSHPVGYQLVLP